MKPQEVADVVKMTLGILSTRDDVALVDSTRMPELTDQIIKEVLLRIQQNADSRSANHKQERSGRL